VCRLTELNAIKATNAKNAISKDTLATIGANLFGIWLILHYERVNLVGSKALSFVQKLR
jgi:serine kinase of HPr protein (carbohydrate metabolism regulator)